jgi:cytochrome c
MLCRAAIAIVLVLLSAVPAPAADDATAGEQVFKRRCSACHAVGEGARNKVGPELNGLFGRPAGSVPGYNYSKANKESGIVWDETVFAAYIRDPRGTVPGTKMTFAGLKSDQEIADLIAYLARFAADGKTVD